MRPSIHSSAFSLSSPAPPSAVPTPSWVSCPVMGSYYRLVTHLPPNPPPHPLSPSTQSQMLSRYLLPALPCPALPCPALPSLLASSTLWDPVAKIPQFHARAPAHKAETASNLLHVCVCVCHYSRAWALELGLGQKGGAEKVHSLRIPEGKCGRHTQQPVHYSYHTARGEGIINTFLPNIPTKHASSVTLIADGLVIPSTSLEEIGFISYFSLQTLFLVCVLLVKCERHNVPCDLHPCSHILRAKWVGLILRTDPHRLMWKVMTCGCSNSQYILAILYLMGLTGIEILSGLHHLLGIV